MQINESPVPNEFTSGRLFEALMAEREEILRHKWFQSEKAGRDIGFEKALFSWMLYHRSLWLESRKGRGNLTPQVVGG